MRRMEGAVSRGLKNAFGAALACGLFGAAVFMATRLQEASEEEGQRALASKLIYLPSVEQARLMALGFRQVVADYYWVLGLQYFTEPALKHRFYRNLGDYLELVIGLDPDFEYAYKFAGIAIPYDSGRLRWKNTRRATLFLERGVKRFPNNWQLHFYLAYNYLNFEKRPADAAEEFRKAGALPGAPTYLSAFAARIYSITGAVDQAIAFAEETMTTAGDPEVRQLMFERLQDLKREKELQRVEAGAKAFRERTGRFPKDMAELTATGFPPPPTGYQLDSSGVASLPGGERMIIHRHPIELDGEYITDDQ